MYRIPGVGGDAFVFRYHVVPLWRLDARRMRRQLGLEGAPFCAAMRGADETISAPSGPEQHERAQDIAAQEKATLARFLKERLGLELSETKTLITPVTGVMRFLGHHVRVRAHPGHHGWVSTSVIPKDRSQLLRQRIKNLFGRRICADVDPMCAR
ncbi:MAG TPA: hypothetical protein VFT22_33610 [Kofleriaceae bacterium]|nr:hypothetical protein [Kofleriaceae bacterium]